MRFDYSEMSATDLLAHVMKNGYSLTGIPVELCTVDMCVAAIKSTAGSIFEEMDDALKTPEICDLAVRWLSGNLAYVPLKMHSKSIIMSALRDNGNMLVYVMDNDKTYDVCLAAVSRHACALEYVPQVHRTAELLQIVEDANNQCEFS